MADVPVDDIHPIKEEPDCYYCNDRGCISCREDHPMSTPDTPQVSAEDRKALAKSLASHDGLAWEDANDYCFLSRADAVIAAGWRPAPTPVEQARPDALEITKTITEAIHEHREDFQRPSEAGTAVAVYERLAHLGMIDRRSAASPVPAEGDAQAERDYDGAVEHYSRVIAVRERQIARLREQRDAARNGHAELSRQRDQWWEHVGQEKAALRAERDALQSRIDEALTILTDWTGDHPLSSTSVAGRLRAALRGTPEPAGGDDVDMEKVAAVVEPYIRGGTGAPIMVPRCQAKNLRGEQCTHHETDVFGHIHVYPRPADTEGGR